MARINSLAAASSLSDNDYLALDQVDDTKKVTVAQLKTKLEETFVKKGTVIFNDDAGVTTAIVTLIVGHLYALDTNSSYYNSNKTGRQRIFFIAQTDLFPLAVNVWNGNTASLVPGTLINIQLTGVAVIQLASQAIYKIIDMGVAQ